MPTLLLVLLLGQGKAQEGSSAVLAAAAAACRLNTCLARKHWMRPSAAVLLGAWDSCLLRATSGRALLRLARVCAAAMLVSRLPSMFTVQAVTAHELASGAVTAAAEGLLHRMPVAGDSVSRLLRMFLGRSRLLGGRDHAAATLLQRMSLVWTMQLP